MVSPSPNLFDFEHVSVASGDGWRVHDVQGAIPASGVTALVGPSGSGKSTLLRLCNRLEVPAEGRVCFRGTDIATIDPLALRHRIGMVFQRPTPFPGTGLDNLQVANPQLTREDALALLARVRLGPEFADREATQLSGGEAQRLCLARTLAVGPDVVLMDEVTSSLDPPARIALERLASKLARDGVPIVWVTHDFGQVRRVAGHVLALLDGQLAHSGEVVHFDRDAPEMVRAFFDDDAYTGGLDAE